MRLWKKQHTNPYKTHETLMYSTTKDYRFKFELKPPVSIYFQIRADTATCLNCVYIQDIL